MLKMDIATKAIRAAIKGNRLRMRSSVSILKRKRKTGKNSRCGSKGENDGICSNCS